MPYPKHMDYMYLGKQFIPVTEHQIMRAICSMSNNTLSQEVDFRAPRLREAIGHVQDLRTSELEEIAQVCTKLPVHQASDKSRLLHYASNIYGQLAQQHRDVDYFCKLEKCLQQNAELVSAQGYQITPLHKILLQGIAFQGMQISEQLALLSQQRYMQGNIEAYTDMLSHAAESLKFHEHFMEAGRLYETYDQREALVESLSIAAIILQDYDTAQRAKDEIIRLDYDFDELIQEIDRVPRNNTQ